MKTPRPTLQYGSTNRDGRIAGFCQPVIADCPTHVSAGVGHPGTAFRDIHQTIEMLRTTGPSPIAFEELGPADRLKVAMTSEPVKPKS